MTATSSQGLSNRTLFRVFWRSLFLQASWNPKGMQNLGMAFALFPAMKELYPQEDAQAEAVRRHLSFFNTHPYVAAAIVGGVLHHEERIARGETRPQAVVDFKNALMGPLAALGDGFFWLSLKPAAGGFCAALVPVLGAWAAVLFLVLYNSVHLSFRARFYFLGYRLGDGLIDAVARADLPRRGGLLRKVAAASAGAAAAFLAVSFGAQHGGGVAWLLSAGCLGVGALSYVLAGRNFPNYALLYLAALAAGLAGALL